MRLITSHILISSAIPPLETMSSSTCNAMLSVATRSVGSPEVHTHLLIIITTNNLTPQFHMLNCHLNEKTVYTRCIHVKSNSLDTITCLPEWSKTKRKYIPEIRNENSQILHIK